MTSESEQDIKQYIEGVEYPVGTFDLITAVEDNGAPAEIVDRLNQLPNDAKFSSPDEVVEGLENIEKSGRPTPEHEVE
ncbi:MAG: DUF2795 domain-containing protein [Actinomycetota bacterium]|nr:DUF2795 domain-containing protein [Actinomycetota bacterium]